MLPGFRGNCLVYERKLNQRAVPEYEELDVAITSACISVLCMAWALEYQRGVEEGCLCGDKRCEASRDGRIFQYAPINTP